MAMTDRAKKASAAAALAIAIAGPAEGIRQVAYYDPPGILTVCRGHTGPDIDPKKVYSIAECDKFMDDDMRKAVEIAQNCMPDAPVTVLASFSDAVFNSGRRIACDTKNSTAARLIKAKQWEAACNEHPKWNKARIAGVLVPLPGLTKRTEERKRICLSGVNDGE